MCVETPTQCKISREPFQLLRQAFDCLRNSRLSVNLPKSEFCKAIVEWLDIIIDRSGVQPAPSKTEAISRLSTHHCRGCNNSPRHEGIFEIVHTFLPSARSLHPSLTYSVTRFQGKKARKSKFPWGTTQRETMARLIDLLINPTILATRSEQAVSTAYRRLQDRCRISFDAIQWKIENYLPMLQ